MCCAYRTMTEDHYTYLLSLPLVLHLAPLHTHVLHGGLLPVDPTRSIFNSRQPLSHPPIHTTPPATPNPPISTLRNIQELSILTHIPQNRDPYTKLEMRSVTDDGVPTRVAGDGAPWSLLWNDIVERCRGFDSTSQLYVEDADSGGSDLGTHQLVVDASKNRGSGQQSLPCHPITVIYGHASSRGLDLKRWSKGIDTGCVSGNRLTGFVIHGHPFPGRSREEWEFDPQLRMEETEFGEGGGKAHVISVPCA